MRNRSIRTRVTLWFTVSLIIVVALSFLSFMTVSKKVVEKTTLNILRDAVEENLDEVEYHEKKIRDEMDQDADYYLKYGDGWIEIDDDFLSSVNGAHCAVYDGQKEPAEMIYGENPVADRTKALGFSNRDVRKIEGEGSHYYVYDRKVKYEGLDNIWIRGVISDEQNAGDITDISKITVGILIIILLIAIIGGNITAGRMLNPVTRITEAASKISKGNDLKERLELGEGSDELHQLADSFNKMMERLDEAFENEQQFTSDVSHELRTPISVIMAQSEFALESGKSEEDYVDALNSVNRQARKMSRLVNDLLTFARLGRDSSIYKRERLDFSALVEGICEDMALIGEKNISLEWKAEQEIFVAGNRELLSRLVSNLIGNAYKYGIENGHIFVSLSAREGKACLDVEDDGIGIADENLSRIFNRMYQVDSSRHDRGSGLGLFMVKEIAQYHSGSISVKSTVGKGSTFTFEIPIKKN